MTSIRYPAHWTCQKLKHVASLRSGESITSNDISDSGEYPVYGGNGVRGYTSSHTHEGEYPLIGRQGALCGNINYASGKFWASEHAVVVHVREGHVVRWLGEVLRSMDLNQYSQSAAQPGISVEVIENLPIPVPPEFEQEVIAAYLDRETARIDRLIAAKERMLALLEEKRAALISRVVTRGLDPNVPLKPSGQEWLGEIPAHWQVQPIKYLAVVGNGSTPSVDNADYWDDQGYPWLNSSVVNVSPVTVASRFVTETALRECHLPKIQPPAVLVGITGQGKTRGMAAVLGVEATINQHLAFIKPRTQALCADYLCHLLGHAYAFLRSDSDGAGSTKGAITCEQLANMKIPVPPRCEQIEICARIGQSLAVSMPVRSKIQASLDLLTERRAALITAAVTGQIPPEEMGA